MDNLNSNKNELLLFEIDDTVISGLIETKNYNNITDLVVDFIADNYNDVHEKIQKNAKINSLNLDDLEITIESEQYNRNIYNIYLKKDIEDEGKQINQEEIDQNKIFLGLVVVKFREQDYKGTDSNDIDNYNCNESINPFLGKVYNLKDKEDEENLEELFNNVDSDFKQFKDVNVYDNIELYKDPKSTEDIIIENLDDIDEKKYIPYPYGPLNRPPVPFDLWRLIRDRKRGN